jgi:ketol-acid reductoisomerase
VPLLADFMTGITSDMIGKGLDIADTGVDNAHLIEVNEAIRSHPVETIGSVLRGHMADMKRIV